MLKERKNTKRKHEKKIMIYKRQIQKEKDMKKKMKKNQKIK